MYIGGITRGSETSQYPEEKKPNRIPPVAASEKGTAQTGPYVKACTRCTAGVVGLSLAGVQTVPGSYQPST